LNGAEASFQHVLMVDPLTPLANYYLSLVHFQMKDYTTSESDLFYEIDNNKNLDAAYYQLGRIAILTQKMDVAQVFLQKAIHLNPNAVHYFNWIYLIYLNLLLRRN